MSDHSDDRPALEQNLFGDDATRSLLDQLLEDSRLYKTSKDYKDLLDFVVRLRNFAPFNAMLLQVQKPGLSYAASSHDWRERFGRYPKDGARPLLILWPFGPVAFVYDVLDTDGESLPEDVSSFVARGSIDESALQAFYPLLKRKHIDLIWVDAGDRNAGLIRVVRRAASVEEATTYSIHINRNHDAPVKFTTLAHELGHLMLGHLGPDKKLRIPVRPPLSHAQQELEAESVAYIVCERSGVKSKSQTYLSSFVTANTTINDLDVYQVMRAAGQVETMLGLAAHAQFDRPVESVRSNAGSVGILAYGSLVSDPGVEIDPLIVKRIETVTPFPVEYARFSSTRGGAPTAVPHTSGSPVKAVLLVLADVVPLAEARNLLWRRETRNERSGKAYPAALGQNAVVIGDLRGFHGLAHVLYTDFNPEGKISNPDPQALADAAIHSVGRAKTGKDGISYLMGLRAAGVETALTSRYVTEILSRTGASDLCGALGMSKASQQERLDSGQS